jgi:hypothetical protein
MRHSLSIGIRESERRENIQDIRSMNSVKPIVIVPTELEACVSGVSLVEVAADRTATMVYENHRRICARLERVQHAVQSNFLALVRRIQNAARENGQRLSSARLA